MPVLAGHGARAQLVISEQAVRMRPICQAGFGAFNGLPQNSEKYRLNCD